MGTGSLLKKILEAQKQLPEHRKKRKRPDATVPQSNVLMFRVVLGVLFLTAVVHPGFAPPKGPKLPEGFCEHGDVTATTGECMCHWQHKDGCVGSACEYQMGLSFYHYSCKDCKCVKEP